MISFDAEQKKLFTSVLRIKPFNLYAAAMMKHALSPLCNLFDQAELSKEVELWSGKILKATIAKFWGTSQNTFINNLPWLAEEKEARMCDRSLATAILFDLVPAATKNMAKILHQKPVNLGISYPANACWRYWALSKKGYVQTGLDEFATRWYNIPSISLNNTLAETWEVKTDDRSQWSHCPVVPFFFTYMDVAGVAPLAPGFQKISIEPRPGKLKELTLSFYTISGAINIQLKKTGERLTGTIELPEGIEANYKYGSVILKLIPE